MSNDPTIIPTSARERKFLALADVRGLSIKRVPDPTQCQRPERLDGVLLRGRCTASWRAGELVLHQGAARSTASMIRATATVGRSEGAP